MKHCSRAIVATSLVAGFLFTSYASAQSVPIPGAADPSRIEKQLEQSHPTEPAAPTLAPPVAALPLDEAPEGAETIKLTIDKLDIVGSTRYSQEELVAAFANRVGVEISLADLYAMAAEITKKYREEGYFLSKAFIPPQRIKGGHVTIQVVEGRIADVSLEGALKHDAIIAGHLERIMAEKPIRIQTLERHLLLLNDLAGMAVRGVVEPIADNDPNAAPGAIRLVLLGQEESGSPSITADNLGSRFIGPYQVTARHNIAGAFAPYHDIGLIGLATVPMDEMQYGSVQYTMPLNGNGTRMEISAGLSHSNPGYTLTINDLQGESKNFRLAVVHPLVRSRQENLSLTAEFAARNNSAKIITSDLYEDRTRSIRVAANYDTIDSWQGANVLSLALSQGLEILGATDEQDINPSRAGGQSDFTKMEASVARLQSLSGAWSAYGNVSGQFASVPLLASEEFGIGGPSLGRGYDPSEYTGDHGLAASLEIRYDLPAIWQGFSAQPFAFYDVGKIWNKDTSSEDAALASAGIGVRFNVGDQVSSALTLAQPLLRDVGNPLYGNGKNPRVLGTLSYRF